MDRKHVFLIIEMISMVKERGREFREKLKTRGIRRSISKFSRRLELHSEDVATYIQRADAYWKLEEDQKPHS